MVEFCAAAILATSRFYNESFANPPEVPVAFIVVRDVMFSQMLQGELEDKKNVFQLKGISHSFSFSGNTCVGAKNPAYVFKSDTSDLYVVPFGVTNLESSTIDALGFTFTVAARTNELWRVEHEKLAQAFPGIVAGKRTCAHCGKPGKLKCGKCKLAYYCNAECQKVHWKMHKLLCHHF